MSLIRNIRVHLSLDINSNNMFICVKGQFHKTKSIGNDEINSVTRTRPRGWIQNAERKSQY